jgi:hypothetical protein
MTNRLKALVSPRWRMAEASKGLSSTEETFVKLKLYLAAPAAILAWAAFAGLAYADPIIDNINGGATVEPFVINAPVLTDLGWVYSPTESYQLSGISSDFSTGETGSQTVTLSFYSGIPNTGTATLLGSGTFTSGAGLLGVTFGTDISIVAGDTYFIGLSNTAGIGVNGVEAAFGVTPSDPVAAGVTYIPSGFYSDELGGTTDFATNIPLNTGPGTEDNAFAAPIFDFYGQPNVSSVPEPSSLALSTIGLVALLLGLSTKRRAASRRNV